MPVTVNANPDPVPLASASPDPSSGPTNDAAELPSTPQPALAQPRAVAPPSAPAPNPAANVETQHNSALGSIVRSLLGTRSTYRTNPETGQVETVPVQNKPGQFFRGILAGAILGGLSAGGAKTPNEGFAMGAEAETKNLQGRDQQAFARAEQANKDAMEKKRLDNEQQLQQAQIAHMHNEDVRADAQMDIIRQDHIDDLNKYNDTLSQGAISNGALESPIVINGQNVNGQQGNGRAIVQQYVKDPKSFDAPQGYHRIHVQKVDTNGLTYKAGTGWVDTEGKPVDMSSRTTHTFYDIPQSAWSQVVNVSTDDLNKMVGSNVFQPGQTKSITYGDLVNLKQKATSQSLEKAKADLEAAQAKRQTELIGLQARQLKLQIDKQDHNDLVLAERSLRDQATELVKQIGASQFDPELKADLKKQLDQVNADLEEVRNQTGFYGKNKGNSPGAGTTQKAPATTGNVAADRATALIKRFPNYGEANDYIGQQVAAGVISATEGKAIHDELLKQAKANAPKLGDWLGAAGSAILNTRVP